MIEYLDFLTQGRREQVKSQAKNRPFFEFANVDCIVYLNGKEFLPVSLNEDV